jgi:hypothetical protein
MLATLGEVYLRFFPPKDLQPYLGEQSPLSGLFVPDPEFGVGYTSWDAFRTDNAERLGEYLPLEYAADAKPLWALFGNSFVQAPRMLADTVRVGVPSHRVFNLGRNEHLMVRFAQIRELLDHGLTPERIFLTLMPLDAWLLAQKPLDSFRVTARGALTFEPRTPPGIAGRLIRHSRLALTAWTRTNRHVANPSQRYTDLHRGLSPRHLADLRHLFAGLARHCHEHRVPVTVILIPTHEQITAGAPIGFQDAIAPMLRDVGIDVFDPREVFCRHHDKPSLFIPDKHFSPAGNALLLAELLHHLAPSPVVPARPVEAGAS